MNEEKIKITNLKKTGTACPAQWEAESTDGKIMFYIRYRHGSLTMGMGPTLADAITNRRLMYQSDDDMDGWMETEEMLQHTQLEVV